MGRMAETVPHTTTRRGELATQPLEFYVAGV